MTADQVAPAATSGEPPAAAGPSGRSPIHRPAVRVLIISRAATTLGMATLGYGAMVFLAQKGASPFIVSLAGATRYLAAVIFGLQGGIVADSVPKRTALVIGYAAQAGIQESFRRAQLAAPSRPGVVASLLRPPGASSTQSTTSADDQRSDPESRWTAPASRHLPASKPRRAAVWWQPWPSAAELALVRA